MHRRILPTLVVILSLALAACAPTATPIAGGKLKVVATYSILGDLVQNVGGDKIGLRVLVGPDSDPHNYEPTPADSVALAEANVVFENGLEFETWLDDLFKASGSQATRVAVSDGIEPIKLEAEHGHGDEHGHEEEHGHEHGEYDPHIWQSVANAKQMVRNIQAALIAADPANRATYDSNAQAYLSELEALEAFIKEQVNTLPPERRKLVTSHDTFGYFARDYGFEIVATALHATAEGAEPSAQEFAQLVEEIKAAGVPAIFAENTINPGLMERLAAEAGVKLGPTLFTDALSKPGAGGETFIKMMRHNIEAIVGALK
ncbi:MAG: metal ABC transporter substrate-binding protein [Anaerolineales bacterium]|nr:metal ABC transporter substrate-binding protein [Anaerolineales bacterium]